MLKKVKKIILCPPLDDPTTATNCQGPSSKLNEDTGVARQKSGFYLPKEKIQVLTNNNILPRSIKEVNKTEL